MKTIKQNVRLLVFSLAAVTLFMVSTKHPNSWSARSKPSASDKTRIARQPENNAYPAALESYVVNERPSSLFASPSAHWGTFRIGTAPRCGGLTFCSQAAFSAFGESGFGGTVKKNNDYSISGRNEESVVVVVCTPISDAELSATVFCASSNNDSAAKWHNEIRARILTRKCL